MREIFERIPGIVRTEAQLPYFLTATFIALAGPRDGPR